MPNEFACEGCQRDWPITGGDSSQWGIYHGNVREPWLCPNCLADDTLCAWIGDRFDPNGIADMECPECGGLVAVIPAEDDSMVDHAECTNPACNWDRQPCADCGLAVFHTDEHGWRHLADDLAGRPVCACFLARM